MPQRDYQIFEIPDFTLQRGLTLPVAEVAYQTYGQLNADKSNVILYPTSYGAQHFDTEWLIGAGRVLDPTDWFIVIPNMFGNGLSSSPSTLPAPFGPDRPPLFTHWDNVHAQERLLREVFGVERIALAYGWSMGAQQSLHWGPSFPTAWTGSARSAAPRAPRRTTSCSSKGCARRSRATRIGQARISAPIRCAVCAPWDGSMPVGRCRRPSTARNSGDRRAIPAGRISSSAPGRPISCAAIPMTCWPASRHGSPPTSPTIRSMAAISTARSGPSPRARS